MSPISLCAVDEEDESFMLMFSLTSTGSSDEELNTMIFALKLFSPALMSDAFIVTLAVRPEILHGYDFALSEDEART